MVGATPPFKDKKSMINGKEIDRVYWRTMMRSIQRMEEMDEPIKWYVCDEGQLLNEFINFSGVIPAPSNCIASNMPIRSWHTGKIYQWFCRIHDPEKKETMYFTIVTE